MLWPHARYRDGTVTTAAKRARRPAHGIVVAASLLVSVACVIQIPRAEAGPGRGARALLTASTMSGVVPKGFEPAAISAVPSTGDVYVLAQRDSKTSLIAYRHDGSWSRITMPRMIQSWAHTIAAAPGALWVAGGEYQGSHAEPFIAERVGGRWNVATLPALYAGRGHYPYERVTGVLDISASSASDAWAIGGMYTRHSQVPIGLRWDGTSWTAVPDDAGYGLGTVLALTTSSPTNAWIADGRAILRWDGTKWSVNKSTSTLEFPSISSSSPTDVWLVSIRRVLHFDGEGWQKVPLPTGVSGANLRAVSVVGTTAWIGGGGGRGIHPLVLRSQGDQLSVVPWPHQNEHVVPGFASAVSPREAWFAGTNGADEQPVITAVRSG
jgi:hypothetical protein